MQPLISATKQNGNYTVHVLGKFGGGYTSPGHTAAAAAAMVVRDTAKYDCGDEPISILLDPAVEAAIEAARDGGERLRACLGCKHLQRRERGQGYRDGLEVTDDVQA